MGRRNKSKDCDICEGTGLYPNAMVTPEIGVVCHYCGGSGSKNPKDFRSFKKRRVEGIKRVVKTHDGFAPPGKNVDLSGSVPYQEFYWKNKMPTT
jgi:hypothetical protein